MVGKPYIHTPDRLDREVLRQDLAEFWGEMSPILVRAVEDSFLNPNTGKMRQYTRNEVNERVEFAKKTIETLRREFKLSKMRIKDMVPVILQMHVMKQPINLDELVRRQSWFSSSPSPIITPGN